MNAKASRVMIVVVWMVLLSWASLRLTGQPLGPDAPAPGLNAPAQPMDAGRTSVDPAANPPATSQPASATAPVAAVLPTRIEVDILALVQANGLLPESISDPVWNVTPATGKRLVALPLLVTPADKAYELTNLTLRLRGGLFIGWHIDPPVASENAAGTPTSPGVPGPGAPGYPVPAGGPSSPTALPRLYEVAPAGGPAPAGGTATANPAANYVIDKPRLARNVTIGPDGTVSWKLDTTIYGATAKEGDNAYNLRVSPTLLNKLGPGPQPVLPRNPGETAKDYDTRRKPIMDDYQAKAAVLADIRKHVFALDTKFTQPKPQRIWAVFDINLNAEDFVFEGPAPLPWAINISQVIALRNLLGPAAPGGMGVAAGPRVVPGPPVVPRIPGAAPVPAENRPTPQMLAYAQLLSDLVKAPPHPISLRLVSEALSRSGTLPLAQAGDLLDQLARTIISGGDEPARTRLVRELAGLSVPTPVTIDLLRLVAKDADPAMQMLALSGLLRADPTNQAQFGEVLATVNRLLADPSGPPPETMLTELASVVGTNAQAAARMSAGVQFTGPPGPRLDNTITAVLAHAASDPVAAHWLNEGLLGSKSPAAARTLELLIQAPVSTAPTPAVSTVPPSIPGQPPGPTPTETRLAVDSPQHALIGLLKSSDAPTQALAWRALPRFVIPAVQPAGIPVDPATPPAAPQNIYQLITDAGLTQQATPPQLVDFLRHQSDAVKVSSQLARVAVWGKGAAAVDAAKTIIDGRVNLTTVFQALPSEARQTLVTRLYEAQTKTTPLVANLARAKDGPGAQSLNWLATQIQQGQLPPTAAWVQGAGGEDGLLSLTIAADDKLATGAVAALLASIGGEDRTVPDLIAKLRVPNATVETVKAQWSKTRQEVFMQRLQVAAGSYRMTIRLFPALAAAVSAPPPPSLGPPAGSLGPPPGYPGAEPPQPTVSPAPPPGQPPVAPPPAPGQPPIPPVRNPPPLGPGQPLPWPGYPGPPAPTTYRRPPTFAPAPAVLEVVPGERPAVVPVPAETLKLPDPEVEVDAGTFQLVADGKSVFFSSHTPAISVPETNLAIRIANPLDFKNIANPKLTQIPWDKITAPLDLLLQDDKSWIGRFSLPDGRTGDLKLTPTSAATQPGL